MAQAWCAALSIWPRGSSERLLRSDAKTQNPWARSCYIRSCGDGIDLLCL